MRILVYEHVSGGGYAGKPIPTNALCEGYAMLRAVAADFQAAGHEVSVLLDSRLSALNPPTGANRAVIVASGGKAEKAIKGAAESADAALVIAPESDGALLSLVKIVEKTPVTSLNSKASSIKSATDKAILSEHLKACGLRVPETLQFNKDERIAEIKRQIKDKICIPFIVKPTDGTSCSGLSVVSKWSQLPAALKKLSLEFVTCRFMVQELVCGDSVSVSLLAANGNAVPLSLNRQDVVLEEPDAESGYEGGSVPYETASIPEAFAAAQKTVSLLKGLRGYVGVDLVLTQDEPVVVEVNPRLTTSYVGLREVADFNVAEAMLNAAVKGKLPRNMKLNGCACFSKVAVPNPPINLFRDMCCIREVACPPFPLSSNGITHALLLSRGKTPKAAELRLDEAKKRLQQASIGGT